MYREEIKANHLFTKKLYKFTDLSGGVVFLPLLIHTVWCLGEWSFRIHYWGRGYWNESTWSSGVSGMGAGCERFICTAPVKTQLQRQ